LDDLAEDLKYLASVGSWERPEDAKALILQGLRSPDAAVQLTALELAAQQMDEEIATAVGRALDMDPKVAVRVRAAIAFGPALETMSAEEGWEGPDLGDLPMSMPRFHDLERRLEEVYRDAAEPKEMRRKALEAAVRSPRPWQQDVIRSAWASDDVEWRLTAVFCMGCVAGFEDEILEAVDSDSPELKIEAVRALGARGIQPAGDDLMRFAASDDTPYELRLVAIEALSGIGLKSSAELLKSLSESADEEIAATAQYALDEMIFLE
jgi:hypothetical protein